MDAAVLVIPTPPTSTLLHDGSCDGRPEVREEKASKTERQTGRAGGRKYQKSKQQKKITFNESLHNQWKHIKFIILKKTVENSLVYGL